MNVLKRTIRAAIAAFVIAAPCVCARAVEPDNAASTNEFVLPDSPGATSSSSGSFESYAGFVDPGQHMAGPGPVRSNVAPKWHRVIGPDETAEKFTAADKFKLSLHENITISNFGSSLFAAGWSQLTDSRPHYGEDMPAFGERFGASMLKGAIQNISRDGIFANVFHEDPHYYVRGRSVPIMHRAAYAASRVFMVRKDNGHHGPYYSNFAAIAVANAMSNFYYPNRDVGQKETAQSIAMGFVTNVATNELKEFLGDAIHLVFHKKN